MEESRTAESRTGTRTGGPRRVFRRALEVVVVVLVTAAPADRRVDHSLAIGQQTPQVASVLVTACSVARADIWRVTRTNLWFIAVLLAILLAVTYLPGFALVLVEWLYR